MINHESTTVNGIAMVAAKRRLPCNPNACHSRVEQGKCLVGRKARGGDSWALATCLSVIMISTILLKKYC